MLLKLKPGCWVEPDEVSAVVVDDNHTVCVIVGGKKRDVITANELELGFNEGGKYTAARREADALAELIREHQVR